MADDQNFMESSDDKIWDPLPEEYSLLSLTGEGEPKEQGSGDPVKTEIYKPNIALALEVAILLAVIGSMIGIIFWTHLKEREFDGQKTRVLLELQEFKDEDHLRNRVAAALPAWVDTGDKIALTAVVIEASRRFQVEPETILALIEIESNYKHVTNKDSGACGYMQVLPDTAWQMAERYKIQKPPSGDPAETWFNVQCGTGFWTVCWRYFQRRGAKGEALWILATAAYLRGPGALAIGDAEQIKKIDYVQKVQQRRDIYRAAIGG